ncbi:ferritin [Desulfobaculum xiamenense]|uniref:Ferritin n=1 Tax=Desulfobaculum xiamenense TaxID=995050 RepID=A0A846QFD4_9BACT|nr:ferritin [Desulfobaculum xiamenense]NJB66951.1 ferritin [Desulfobaculum xiamenense]
MLSGTMEKALSEQIKWELYSSYLYLSMSGYFATKGLPGFANWMRIQAQEELFHAMKFHDYVLERGGRVKLAVIDAPPATWKHPEEVFEETLKHEQQVTRRINDLMDVAQKEKDHACGIFLQWFISEQVEEEDSVSDALNKLRLVGKDGGGLFMLDRELGMRVFTPPTAAQ